jgi:hypothetical protein
VAQQCGACGAWIGGGAFNSHGCGELGAPGAGEAATVKGEPTVAETKAELKELKAQGQGDTRRARVDRQRLRAHYAGLGIGAVIVAGLVLLFVVY